MVVLKIVKVPGLPVKPLHGVGGPEPAKNLDLPTYNLHAVVLSRKQAQEINQKLFEKWKIQNSQTWADSEKSLGVPI